MKTKFKIPEALVKTTEPAVELEPISTELEQASDMLLDSVLQTKEHMQTYYDTLLNAENPEITDIEVRQKLDSYKRAAGNIKKAHLVTSDITDELSARWSDLRNSQKRKLIPSAPANAVIDAQESRSNHFARGLNAYKLLLLCFIGSFLGVVVELGWCHFDARLFRKPLRAGLRAVQSALRCGRSGTYRHVIQLPQPRKVALVCGRNDRREHCGIRLFMGAGNGVRLP